MNMIRTWTLICLALLVSVEVLVAQEQLTSLKKVIVFIPGREAISGRLLAVEENSIVVLTAKSEERIAYETISRILLAGESRPAVGPLYGAIFGGYAATYLFVSSSRGPNRPTGFMPREYGLALLLLIGPSTLAGAGVGYLIDSGSDGKEEFFDFTGGEAQRRAEQRRLRNFFRGAQRERSVHISLQGGQVFPATIAEGASQGPSMSGSFGSYADVTSFNVLRRFQATYSVQPDIEVGLAAVWFGEPGDSWYSFGSAPDYRSVNVWRSLNATGGYAVGAYKPFHESLGRSWDLTVGGGVGMASIDYTRQGTSAQSSYVDNVYTSSFQNLSYQLSEKFVSGFLYGELRVNCDETLSLGLVADHVFVFAPSQTIPADPLLNSPAQTLNFGNTSVGFSVGLHF